MMEVCTDHNQLSLILAVTGTPTLDEFYKINSRRSRDYLRALPFQKKKNFAELFPNASPAAVDFMTKTLAFDPTKRLTVEECLEHRELSLTRTSDFPLRSDADKILDLLSLCCSLP